MADTIVSNLCEFKLRRGPEGIRITVTSTPEFEASLKTRARGDTIDKYAGDVSYFVWNVRENPAPSDQELGHLLFLEGSSRPGGATIVAPVVRSRDQLVKVAEEISAYVERHFANYMRAVEVTASIKARTVFGLNTESPTPPVAVAS